MKSLLTLLTYHLLFSSLLIFIIVSGNLPIYDIVLLPVFVPALNKGLTYLKIEFPKNAHTQPSTMLYDSILSILTTADAHFKQLEILYTANYRHPFFYYLSLLSLSIRKRKSVKPLIQEVTNMKKEDFTTRLTSKSLSHPRSF